MNTLYTLPVLLLSVVLAFLLGKGLPNAAAALCVVYIPQYFRRFLGLHVFIRLPRVGS